MTQQQQSPYRIIHTNGNFKVEVNRPGEVIRTADGFKSEAEAYAWIEEDKRIAEIDGRQERIDPPHLRDPEPGDNTGR